MSYADGLKTPKHNSQTAFAGKDQGETRGTGTVRNTTPGGTFVANVKAKKFGSKRRQAG